MSEVMPLVSVHCDAEVGVLHENIQLFC